MLNVAFLGLTAAVSRPQAECRPDDNSAVCMLQLKNANPSQADVWQSMHREVFGGRNQQALVERQPTDTQHPAGPEHHKDYLQPEHTAFDLLGEGIASDPLEHLQPHRHGHSEEEHDCPECPGQPFIGEADSDTCGHIGADVHVNFDDEDIEEFFGDNVIMKEWKYFKEGCHKPAQCELIDPDINHHEFPVGKSVIRVEGIDIAGNMNDCHRTVYILDKQDPKFVVPSKEVDSAIEIDFPEDSCKISGDKPFIEYEEVNGFIAEATDNCDREVTIVKKLQNSTGDIVYDSSTDSEFPDLKGPSTYTLIYEAVDDYSVSLFNDAPDAVKTHLKKTVVHEATLTLNDIQPPFDFESCPPDFPVEIDPHETETEVFWSPPTITGDNCDEFGTIPEAEEQSKPDPKYPGMTLAVGAHPVKYAFRDASGNLLDKECRFTITVVQRAHPVTITCPENVTTPTLLHADFGLPEWIPAVAMQGPNQLDASHISYPQGVEVGMPFPFGTTVITVRADGEITGTRIGEELMFDECTFTVTVTDPQIPKIDGRMYRCKGKSNVYVSTAYMIKHQAAPYEVCNGVALDWLPHDTYTATHGYDVLATTTRDMVCCKSEDNVDHSCQPVPGATNSSYCVPEE